METRNIFIIIGIIFIAGGIFKYFWSQRNKDNTDNKRKDNTHHRRSYNSK